MLNIFVSAVEEESDFVNVARLEDVEVDQSRERGGGKEERAIDGNYNSYWDLNGIFHLSPCTPVRVHILVM